MSLGLESTARIDNKLATIRVVPAVDKFVCFARLAQPQRVVCDQLVRSKTIVQFYDTDLVTIAGGGKTCLSKCRVGGIAAHAEANYKAA